ncbi:MAG TPA: CooT family nickel-binding protein [Spirochaetota bacterium]|nr:CooT family nickel-binding protein [Spirochaetota bacterium]
MPTVWIKDNAGEEQIFADTAILRVEDGTVVLSTLFGEQKVVRAVIEKIDFMNSRVILKKGF